MMYQALTYTGKNTTISDLETYYGDPLNFWTKSMKKLTVTYNNDTHPNPFYAITVNYPPIIDYWSGQPDYALPAANNPASALLHTEYHDTDVTDDQAADDQTDFLYAYDSISHYPLQQSYTVNEGDHVQSYTLYFNYKTVITTKK